MGLGLRAPMPNYQQPQAPAAGGGGPVLNKATTLFVGSISPGISDSFLTSLFAACGPLRSFKRLQTPAGKPQAFGFAEFEEPDAVSRALQLLDGRLLPSLEGGPPKKLSVKADQKTQGFLKTYEEQRMQSSDDEVAKMTSETLIGSLIAALTDPSALPQQDQLNNQKTTFHGLGNKPVGFVKESGAPAGNAPLKTDEEREKERLDARRREEDNSFRDRERRYEPRERQRIAAIERQMQRERGLARAEEKDRQELGQRLAEWDDDQSDEPFYVDRARWRQTRARFLASETAADDQSRALEARQAEHLRLESEAFLARQMDELRALAEEQRKAGLLLDDGAPVQLAISAIKKEEKKEEKPAPKPVAPKVVFGAEDDEDLGARRRRGQLVKLDFEAAEKERIVERLHKVRDSVPKNAEALWKAKVKWDALTDAVVDNKILPLATKKLVEYLGELDDDDMVVFIVDHVKGRKPPQELVEALEPVLVEEATDLVLAIWRQVVFESGCYGEGLESGQNFVDQDGPMAPA
ncbi:RNA recognition motif protein [Ceratobasidium sp. AG-Ba]|nr:RNA recognition motif protein [Ceratobasidium sp. AG-Ba]